MLRRALVTVAIVVVVGLVTFALAERGPGARFGDRSPPRAPSAPPAKNAPVPKPKPEPMTVVAYVPYWDQARAFSDVLNHRGAVTEVSPFWYAPAPDGSVVVQDAESTDIDRATVATLRRRGMRVLPVIANHRNGVWDDTVASIILQDKARTAAHIAAITKLVVGAGYDGIEIDYEALHANDRAAFSTFVRTLASSLHRAHKLLAVAVLPKTADADSNEHAAAEDYAAIGGVVDELRVMAYDEHWAGSDPGPVAPVPWVASVLEFALMQAPADKVVLGCPLYGYDWPGGGASAADAPSTELTALARQHSVPIAHDASSDASWFQYHDALGVTHTVWFEDANSLQAKTDLIRRASARGIALWRFGGVDPRVFTLARAFARGT